MIPPSFARHLFLCIAVLLTLASVVLVWAFRFLPLYDYPIWLYEVHLLRGLSSVSFTSLYELRLLPVPNLGFILPVWALSYLFPLEVCGKLVLSLCVALFPWAVWLLVERLSGDETNPAAYIGFPFAFNMYVYGGIAFLVGFTLALGTLAYVLRRWQMMTVSRWIALGALVLATYCAHALAFALLMIVLAALAPDLPKARDRVYLTSAVVPALACVLWYVWSSPVRAGTGEWSWWGLAQNLFKPLFLFIKSYGVSSPLPLTVLNVVWLSIVFVFIVSLYRQAKRSHVVDERFRLPALVSAVAMVALPKEMFGVYEPGVRFGLPALIFASLMFREGKVSSRWRTTFLVVTLCVIAYNAMHFRQVNQQMAMLYSDIVTQATLEGRTFRSLRFDYPPARRWWDVAATSVDPLFGVVYYAALEQKGGAAWIFGSGILKPKNGTASAVVPVTDSKEILARKISSARAPAVDVLVLVGQVDLDEKGMRQQFPYIVRRPQWTILSSNGAREDSELEVHPSER